MRRINRRTFFSNSLMTVAAFSVPTALLGNEEFILDSPVENYNIANGKPEIIDTNINLLEYPFRRLKYGKTGELVEKLKEHRISQAWAGSFEALFHKNIDAVNFRLAEECKNYGKGMLLAFGTINIAWPDWQEDLRRCHEDYKMPGVRIYPIYQTFDFNHPDFSKLVQEIANRNMILQIVGDIDDSRNIHPLVQLRGVNFEPIIDILKKVPNAKVQFVYWNNRVGGKVLERFIHETNVLLDTARIETNGGISRLIEGKPWNGTANPVPVTRILFGSHAPYFPIEDNLLKLFESPLSMNQLQAIMNQNATKFLKS